MFIHLTTFIEFVSICVYRVDECMRDPMIATHPTTLDMIEAGMITLPAP